MQELEFQNRKFKQINISETKFKGISLLSSFQFRSFWITNLVQKRL